MRVEFGFFCCFFAGVEAYACVFLYLHSHACVKFSTVILRAEKSSPLMVNNWCLRCSMGFRLGQVTETDCVKISHALVQLRGVRASQCAFMTFNVPIYRTAIIPSK